MIGDVRLRIVLIDDEKPVRRFIQTLLEGSFLVFEAEKGLDGLQSIARIRPDVVILDLRLPDMDGLDVIHRLREWSHIPVLVISVRDSEEDKVAALDAGADDFLAKPFGGNELMARVRALIRRSTSPEPDEIYRNDDLIVDLTRREVRVSDQAVGLTPTEYELLKMMVQHAGKVITHQQLMESVWSGGFEHDAHLIRVNVSNLRRKIERDPLHPRHILTEPGVGYRLLDSESIHKASA